MAGGERIVQDGRGYSAVSARQARKGAASRGEAWQAWRNTGNAK